MLHRRRQVTKILDLSWASNSHRCKIGQAIEYQSVLAELGFNTRQNAPMSCACSFPSTSTVHHYFVAYLKPVTITPKWCIHLPDQVYRLGKRKYLVDISVITATTIHVAPVTAQLGFTNPPLKRCRLHLVSTRRSFACMHHRSQKTNLKAWHMQGGRPLS